MIEVSGLTKTYGNKRGITDISFTINEGEIVGFLGPNGAGKSTTMNVLTGYCPPLPVLPGWQMWTFSKILWKRRSTSAIFPRIRPCIWT